MKEEKGYKNIKQNIRELQYEEVARDYTKCIGHHNKENINAHQKRIEVTVNDTMDQKNV